MQFTFTTLVITALVTLASAGLNTTQEFYLKTKVISGEQALKDLYLTSYHSGAGTNDAVLLPSKDHASRGFLNDTHLEFDLGGEFPYGMSFGYAGYTGWNPVFVNGGLGSIGFDVVNEIAVYNGKEFGGWLACKWSRGVVQLFQKLDYYKYDLPCGCALVDLVVEYI